MPSYLNRNPTVTKEQALLALLESRAGKSSFLKGTFTLAVGSVAGLSSATQSVTVQGAAVGDTVTLNPRTTFGTTVTYYAYISAPNTVLLVLVNAANQSTNTTTGIWDYLVIKAEVGV